MMESFLLGSGGKLREQFIKQETLINFFTGVAKFVQNAKPTDRESTFRKELEKLPSVVSMSEKNYFVIPIDPTIKLSKLSYDNCKFFDSKTVILKFR
jgi:hypothetical protein